MPNTFFGLTIAKSGLYAYQAAINTAAHNSSNADTVGYSRQQAVRSASTAISIPGSYGMVGTGIDVTSIEQIRNQYYDVKFWNNNAVYGDYNTKEYYLKNIENYLSEVNADGTTSAFDDIFTSLSGLSTSAGEITKRTEVAEYSQTFTEYMNYIYKGLQQLQEESNAEIKNTADKINSIAEQITNLTKQINTVEVRGSMANDLRDARALLVDELSELANVTVTEQSVGDKVGVNQYIVRLDGKTLVDTYEYNKLIAVPQETSVNSNDVDGLYQLKWSNGQNFDAASTTLTGALRGLFDIRDGNNKLNFNGTVTAAAGDSTVTISDANITDFNLLNIPAENGKITIGGAEYVYDKFTATQVTDADGNVTATYTFTLAAGNEMKSDVTAVEASIGGSVDYKGIPYYMAQMNEFVRTFATDFNEIHKTGQGLDGKNEKLNFFTSKDPVTGEDIVFAEAVAGAMDKTLTVDSAAYNSYFHMNIGNFKVNADILEHPEKIACAENRVENGIEDTAVLDKLIALKTDVTMFKQGRPDAFLQTLVGVLGIDGKAAAKLTESQDNIVKAIDAQRMSVSGVDSDEEAMDLVKFKSIYDLNSKVVSIMNEIYNKLINETGI